MIADHNPFEELIEEAIQRDGARSLRQWADHWGIPRSTIRNLLVGRTRNTGDMVKPSLETLPKLARAFGMPAHELLYMLEPEAFGADLIDDVEQVRVGVAGWVGAGPEQHEATHGEYIWLDRSQIGARKNVLAFRIRGDSMAAGPYPIHDSALVIVDRDDHGTDGSAVVARLRDNGYVCKMRKIDKYGDHLVSRNPAYTNGTPPYIPASDVAHIVGRVVVTINPHRD